MSWTETVFASCADAALYRHSKSVRHAVPPFRLSAVCLAVRSRLGAKPNRPINRRGERDGRGGAAVPFPLLFDHAGGGGGSDGGQASHVRSALSDLPDRPIDRRRSAINFFFAVCCGFWLPFQKRLLSFLPRFPLYLRPCLREIACRTQEWPICRCDAAAHGRQCRQGGREGGRRTPTIAMCRTRGSQSRHGPHFHSSSSSSSSSSFGRSLAK